MKKDLFILFIIAVVIVFIVTGTKIQSVEDYYLTHLDDIKSDSETVFLSIDCATVFDNLGDLDPALNDEKYVPADGFILPPTEYVLRKGDSVFDILDRAVRHKRIHMATERALTGGVQVLGINQLFKFSCGPLSGWTYLVNGVSPDKSCSLYKPKDGDIIKWRYSCDLGRDVTE